MCFGLEAAWLPLLIGGVASAAGGAISSGEDNANAQRIVDARNGVLTHQLNLNNTLANDARGQFNGRVAGIQPATVAADQAALTGGRATAIDSNMPTITPTTFPGAAGSSSLVKGAYKSAVDDAIDKAHERTDAQAKLGGYGDLFFDQGMKDADTGRNITTDVNFAKANTDLLPSLQDLAGSAVYKPNSGIGSILQGLGSAFGSYAGSH